MYSNIRPDANGDLLVTVDNQTRREIREDRERGRDYWSVLADVFEPYYTNGSYEPFNAGLADPFVGLTDTACVAESMALPDDGSKAIVGRLWFFEKWDTQDPLEQLWTRGRTVFKSAGVWA